MQTLLKFWETTLYLRPVGIFLVATLLILIYTTAKKTANIPPTIRWYLFAYLICFVPIDITILITKKRASHINPLISSLDYLFTIAEFIFITYYFYYLTHHSRQKKVLRLLVTFFILISLALIIYILSSDLDPRVAVVWLYTTQVFLLLVPVFFYFKNLFRATVTINISQQPSFWISSAIAFFLLCTMLLSLIETFFLNHRTDILLKLYPLYYLFYIIMFGIFFKAHLCKPAISKL